MTIHRRMKIDPHLSSGTKLNSKRIKVLGIKLNTLILIDYKLRNRLELIGIGTDFLNRILITGDQ